MNFALWFISTIFKRQTGYCTFDKYLNLEEISLAQETERDLQRDDE